MSAVITVCTALTSRGPCFQTRSPATPRGSWFTAITSAAVKISFASLLRLRKSAPMNRGDFSRDHRAKWLLCSFTVKPALPTCSQHQPDVSSFTCAKGGRRGGRGGGGVWRMVQCSSVPLCSEEVRGEGGGRDGLQFSASFLLGQDFTCVYDVASTNGKDGVAL